MYSLPTRLGAVVIAFACTALLSSAQVAQVKEAPEDKAPLASGQTVKLSFAVTGLPDYAYLISASCNYFQGSGARFPASYAMGPAVSIALHPDKGDKRTLTGSGKIPDDAAPGEYTLRACILRFNSERLKNDGEPDFDRPVRFDPPLTIHIEK